MKGLGDHTNELVDRAMKEETLWIRVDGPYGKISLNYKRYPVVFLASLIEFHHYSFAIR